MKQHSDDYKLTAVKYYLENNTPMRYVCKKIFKCKYQSLSKWKMRFQKEGKIERKPRNNKDLKITPQIVSFVKQNVRIQPTITLWELSKLVDKQFSIKLSDHTIYNILHQNKITRKRLKNKYYPEKKEGQEKDDLSTFYKQLSAYKYDKTICLDETSIYLNMTSSYGRSKTGTRAIYKTNKYPFKRYNMLCAISANKVIGYVLYKDLICGVKTQNIIDFYNEVIKDKYKDHLIIMDNAVIHKSKIVRQTIEESGNHLLYSVPYHPETNAIEEFFSQLKHYIKKESPNTYDDIQLVIKDIIKNKITKEHLTNYLKHSFRMYKNK
jgi:transposase